MNPFRPRPSRRFALAWLCGSIVTFALTAAPFGRALADPPAPGNTIRGATAVTAAEVQSLMTGQGERVIIIDARKPGLWEKGHLARALKLNWRYSNVTRGWQLDAKGLGADKAAPLVIYGQDANDGWAGLAVEKAVAEGYTNVMWLRGGFAEWVAASLPVQS